MWNSFSDKALLFPKKCLIHFIKSAKSGLESAKQACFPSPTWDGMHYSFTVLHFLALSHFKHNFKDAKHPTRPLGNYSKIVQRFISDI